MTADERHNERIKAFATLLNTMAGSCFTVGVIAPIAAEMFYKMPGMQPLKVLLGGIIWLTVAGLLHLAVQAVLKGLLK